MDRSHTGCFSGCCVPTPDKPLLKEGRDNSTSQLEATAHHGRKQCEHAVMVNTTDSRWAHQSRQRWLTPQIMCVVLPLTMNPPHTHTHRVPLAEPLLSPLSLGGRIWQSAQLLLIPLFSCRGLDLYLHDKCSPWDTVTTHRYTYTIQL